MFEQERDYNELIPFFKKNFPIHNMFSKSFDEIKEYLEQNELIYHEQGGMIVGCVVVRKRDGYYSINHLAVDSYYRKQGFGTLLMNKALEIVPLGEKIIVKITDKNLFYFIENFGFKFEKELPEHYRKHETVYLFTRIS